MSEKQTQSQLKVEKVIPNQSSGNNSSLNSKKNDDLVSEPQKKTHDELKSAPKEINGPRGLEPTRYGDWEAKGRCYDF